eukprot:CAMPEP_0113560248 /NCGR_PEP_ID=MMETSP0015_2-20120614/19328_1 /TAXON_ID=2838 /ORGANISM="Odontella" /LENGTH=236 /DNA_ID=CAMNT_0000461937 /DNA_START=74 /DNA_END=784 /DNA_ORIENTATION=+ /assembly_acc=CAM_ASM_000160
MVRMTAAFFLFASLAGTLAFSPMTVQQSHFHLESSLLEEVPTMADTMERESSDLPPLLQGMVDERREYEINLGRAMDTLRKDYPNMLHKTPDFSIFHKDLSVVDPSGVQLSGLKNYKHSFRFLQTVVGFFYAMESSTVGYRMVYDWARSSIKMSWNAVLVPKVVGNRRNAVYIDGISVYKMDSESGKIVEHRVENMIINGTPVQPPYGIFTALGEELLQPMGNGVPAGVGAMISTS